MGGRAPALVLFSCFIKVGADGRGGRGGRGGYGGRRFAREADAVPDDAQVFRCAALRRRPGHAGGVRRRAVRGLYFRTGIRRGGCAAAAFQDFVRGERAPRARVPFSVMVIFKKLAPGGDTAARRRLIGGGRLPRPS